jgi:hypothetical protein
MPVLNADLHGQKPMRRFRSPQGPALRAGQFSAAALWQAPCGKKMKGMINRAFATVPPQKTPSEAPHRLLLADPRRTKRRLSALFSAFHNTELSNSLSPRQSRGFTNIMNTPPAERVVSGSPQDGGSEINANIECRIMDFEL